MEKLVVIGGWTSSMTQNTLEFWFKVDVGDVHVANIPLMHPHETNDHVVVRDVVGTFYLWNWKYVKVASSWTF
jgi:hypothetical protein